MNKYVLVLLISAIPRPASSADDIGQWRATGYARLDDAAAVPYLTQVGRSRYQEFLTHPSPRAFVICPDGRFATIYGGSAGVERELNKRPSGCEPYVVNDAVVWKGKNASSRSMAGIVECRNATGTTEFRQECPPGTAKVRDVKVSGAGGGNAGATARGASIQELETEFQRRRIQREGEEAKERQANIRAQSNCDDARQRLNVLQLGIRVILAGRSAPDGGPVYMDDEARAREIELQKKRLQACGQ
jgi:hypothetical protein